MAVNQIDKVTSESTLTSNNSDVAKPSNQQTITVMKLQGNSVNNSIVNGSVPSNEYQIENIPVSITSTSISGDQNVGNNQLTVNVKQSDVGDLSKGENLQQLSTNALPPYTPGDPPRFIRQDIKAFDIHCCTDCGDTFALKSSLSFHLERRSVLIKLPCESCKTTRIFYNRCNLLSHVRAHTDKNEKCDIGRAVVTVLPRVFMDGIQNEFVNTLDDELNSIDDNDVLPPTEMLECSLQEYDVTLPVLQNEPEPDPSVLKVKCLDCNEEFESAKERQEHLINGNKIPVPMSQCNKCAMICPSKCSFKAHQRLHLQISPYVCPECGESPDPHWNNFIHHVNFKCLHNTRAVGYKCPVCKLVINALSPSNEILLKHMELHTEKYAKCSECPRAYNSTQAFKAHNGVHHDGETVHYTMIYKCSLCDIVFVSNDQMLNHRSTHLKEQVCEYVFNCIQCGKALESKAQLLDHVKQTHPKIYKQNIQDEPITNKPISPINYRGNVECILCNSTLYSQQGYTVHVQRVHINVNQNCQYCSKLMPNRKEMVKHGQTHLKNKHVVCLLCNNKKVFSVMELDSHLNNHIKKLKSCSCCPICESLLPSLPEALNHLREEHYLPMKIQIGSFEPSKQVTETVCHFCRDSFGNDTELQAHLKKKHKIDCEDSRFDLSESNEQLLKKQRIEGNACAKCQFHSIVREDFKKHVLSHKTNRSTFQCQECGLCFVVQPSLTKHLRIVHKITDPTKYISEEGTNFIPDSDNSSDISKRSALECSVCFTSFPNETTLKTHMRSHGMAFIQANKSGLL